MIPVNCSVGLKTPTGTTLTSAIKCVFCQIDNVLDGHEAHRSFVDRCDDLITNLIDLMDRIGPDPDLEDCDPRENVGVTRLARVGPAT
jgi:hypothetical protein